MELGRGVVWDERDVISECLELRQGALPGPLAQAFVEQGWVEIAIGVVAQQQVITR
jgi:hypothetical protein